MGLISSFVLPCDMHHGRRGLWIQAKHKSKRQSSGWTFKKKIRRQTQSFINRIRRNHKGCKYDYYFSFFLFCLSLHSEWILQVHLIVSPPFVRQTALIKFLALCSFWLCILASDFMRVFIWVSFNIIEGVLVVNGQPSLYLAHLISSFLASLMRSDYYEQCLCPGNNQYYLVYLCIFFLSLSHHWNHICTAGISWICSGHFSVLFFSEPRHQLMTWGSHAPFSGKRCSIPIVLYCQNLYMDIQI